MERRDTRSMKSETGTTLVELIIAMALLAVGILAVAQLFPAGTRGQVNDRMMTAASFYAQEKIERLSELQWSHAELAIGTYGPESVGASGVWKRTYQVQAMPPPLENLKKVTVIVTWKSGADTVKTITYLRR